MRETRIKQLPLPDAFTRLGEIGTWRSVWIPLLLLTGVFVLWVISLPGVDPSQMNDLGLVSVLPVTFYAALVILAISYLMVLHRGVSNETILLLHILLLIFILHGTPQIVYGTLRYSWAWKHIGIVDYIQRHGSVDPSITNLNAYHNWPGFFALAAFYNQLAGLQSSLSYAGWAPFFFNLLDLGALLMIFRSLTIDRRLVWLGILFFYLFSWVGQDYFSPQAFVYFFYLITLALILKWFRVSRSSFQARTQTILHTPWITRLYHRMIDQAIPNDDQSTRSDPFQRVFIMSTLILMLVVIASSHQLTPLMVISALTLLMLFQVSYQRYLPVLMTVITVVWIIFMAVGFLNGNLYWIVKSIGSLFDNVNGNLLDLAIASPGQQVIAYIDRIMSVLVWVLGFSGFYRRYRSGHWDLPALILAGAPLPMLALNSYGGEMLFRVYLFSLPFVTFLAAALFYPDLRAGTSFKTPLSATLLSLLLIPGFLFAYYGKERMYYFSPGEVEAAQFVYNNAPKGALIFDGTWDWPRQSTHYEYYNYLSLVSLPKDEIEEIMRDPLTIIGKLMDDAAPGSVFVDNIGSESESEVGSTSPASKDSGDYPSAYFVITRSQIAEAEMRGILPGNWYTVIIQALSKSDNFKVVFSNSDAIVIEFLHLYEPVY